MPSQALYLYCVRAPHTRLKLRSDRDSCRPFGNGDPIDVDFSRRSFYGWGIRWIPGGWLWNVSGLDGVELVLVNNRRFRVGTDEPEQLAAAIQGALRNA
jgi:hypothetical protein